MNRLLLWSVVGMLAILAGISGADDDRVAELIDQGLEAYAEAQTLTDRNARLAAFTRAEQLFSEAARQGETNNADLYANAGTAALQAERLGPAVLAFRRALAIDPDHPRAARNLAHARTLLPAWVPRSGAESVLDTFFFWHRSLSNAERAGIGATCFLLGAIALAIGIRWSNRLARGLAVMFAAAWLGLIASLMVRTDGNLARQAVITAEETLARASDSANAPARFTDPLPGGTEVVVIEKRDRWARVQLANDQEAWVNRHSLETVKDEG